MYYGRISLAHAKGTILAHTLRLDDGRVLAKGHALSESDLEALASVGYTDVVAARLEPEDIAEDIAAAAYARAIAGTGIRLTRTMSGRCSLHAATRGLFIVDPAQIDRLNAVSESVTLATIQPWSLVEAGTLVATVKIIPFAVPREVFESCLRIATEGQPALRVAPFRPMSAGLVVTHLPGRPKSRSRRARGAQRIRLERLGGQLRDAIECAHDVEAIAHALGSLVASGVSPVLVYGAESTVDRGDVIPAAIERAGGTVEQLGMPTDPGHLLVLGRIGQVPVIGLPGCAVSLKPNGLDRVLERISAGVEISARMLSQMGTGGLFASRQIPVGQSGRTTGLERLRKVGAVVLAAGLSRRLGAANKLLEEIDGTPIVCRAVDAVLASTARPVIVVTGHEGTRVRETLGHRDVTFVDNTAYEEGLASSIRSGISALAGSVDAAVICLGDMPFVRSEHIDALIVAYNQADAESVCVPVYEGLLGNPVLWPARDFAELRQLSGDAGARRMLMTRSARVCHVTVEHEGVTIDVDTQEMLDGLRRGAGAANQTGQSSGTTRRRL